MSIFLKRKQRGFALVVTLSLMILLTVIAVGLLSLSAISLRVSGQEKAMATARANARLALIFAVGELQQSLGPDNSITATSGILSPSPAKAQLTGVWASWNYNPGEASLDYRDAKDQRFRRWLVSTPDPAVAEGLDFSKVPWSGETVELVGDFSLGGAAPDDAKVVAGMVPISSGGKVRGSYAWHVADESVKARINQYRDPAQNNTVARKRALLAGHRPDSSVMKGADGSYLDFLPEDFTAEDFEKSFATTDKIFGINQVELLGGKRRIHQFRNDVTPYSLGLLTDVRGGGLKQDLSSVFEMNATLPPEFSDNKLYASTHGITGVSDPNWSTLSSYYNSFRKIVSGETSPTYSGGPTEDQLVTRQTPPTRYFPGPVIAKVETLFSFVIRDSHSGWVGSLKNADPKLLYMAHLVYTPLVTLHNPYNVNISFDTMEVVIRNVPVAFRFYVNGRPQNTRLVPLCEMYVNAHQRGEKSFALKIGDWASPTSSSPAGKIVMKPGQTLVCGPYLDPNATFGNGNKTFFDFENDLTGYNVINGVTTVAAIKAKPGFYGRCVGFDIDWLAPTHTSPTLGALSDPSLSTDGNVPVLGLRSTDKVHMEYAVHQPSLGLNTAFEVTAKLTSAGSTFNYGGLRFQYHNKETLDAVFPQEPYRYPKKGYLSTAQAYVPNSNPISSHANAQTLCVFSAYARTTNGGVFETQKRTETDGSLNELKDGRLAGKPFLFHNPARTVVRMDLKREKLGAHSHELNFQMFASTGDFEKYLVQDSTNRTPSLMGNTVKTGIKSGSYLELPTGPMQTIADFRRSNALTSSYVPNFVQPVSNSLLSPLMSADKAIETDITVAPHALLDHSVLANHALYDRFYFSTFATHGSSSPEVVFERFMDGSAPLASQAFKPYLPSGSSNATAKSELYSSGNPNINAYRLAAEFQMVNGAFNVNSTSVQAWKAMLSSMNRSELVVLWAKNSQLEFIKSVGTPVMAMSLVNAGSAEAGGLVNAARIDNPQTNEWNGYRELSEAQLELLAEKIVEQVRSRGPFLSMSEFVNRRMGPLSDLTRMGALEQAVVESRINDQMFKNQIPITEADIADPALYNYKSPAASVGNPAAGAPGWISQGDLMRILEPTATVRSDTFVIRVCGEARDAAGSLTARAYAEAVVQRIPDYVDPVDRPSVNAITDNSAAHANKVFGRRINVLSFRWLSSKEI